MIAFILFFRLENSLKICPNEKTLLIPPPTQSTTMNRTISIYSGRQTIHHDHTIIPASFKISINTNATTRAVPIRPSYG